MTNDIYFNLLNDMMVHPYGMRPNCNTVSTERFSLREKPMVRKTIHILPSGFPWEKPMARNVIHILPSRFTLEKNIDEKCLPYPPSDFPWEKPMARNVIHILLSRFTLEKTLMRNVFHTHRAVSLGKNQWQEMSSISYRAVSPWKKTLTRNVFHTHRAVSLGKNQRWTRYIFILPYWFSNGYYRYPIGMQRSVKTSKQSTSIP